MLFGKRSQPCGDCVDGYCTMNCGPALAAPITVAPVVAQPLRPKAPPLPEGFKVICSVCADSLDAATQFSKGQLKKKHPRCRACAPNKFSNQKGTGRASNKETRRAQYLQTLQAAGLISNLREQVDYELIPAQYAPAWEGQYAPPAEGMIKVKLLERACSYRADFVYNDERGVLHVEDAKGMRTDVYKVKKKLMLWFHKIRIEEV